MISAITALSEESADRCFNKACVNRPQQGAPNSWRVLTIHTDDSKIIVLTGCRGCIEAFRKLIDTKM